MIRHNTRRRVLLSTALVPVTLALAPTAALADCLPNAAGTTVTCSTLDVNGFDGSSVTSLTVDVLPTAEVQGTLSTGATSAINNEGFINVTGGTAASLGAGSRFSNAASDLAIVNGDVSFAAAGTGQTNVFQNLAETATNNNATFTGNVTSAGGAFTFANQGDGTVDATFTGDVTSSGVTTITNGGVFSGNINSTGDTTIDNTGGITGDITLGAGNDTITTTGTIDGNIDLGAGTNTIGFGSNAALPTGTLTADAAGLNTVNLFGDSPAVDSLDIAVTNFDVLNKTGTGTWDIAQAVSLSDRINVDGGVLSTGDADFLGANTIVNNATVEFTGTADGTYSGVMSGTGGVNVSTGAGVTTFSGANTYTGTTDISSGTLRVTGGAAIVDTGAVVLSGTGILDVAATETIGDLSGTAGEVTLSGGNLLVNSGDFSGVISGTNGIEKIGTGTLTLGGTNTFAGTATVTNGTLELTNGDAIADTTAVVVNANATATPATSGTLLVSNDEEIGSLAGNGGSVVLDAGLTTGGDDTSTSYAGVISGAGSLTKEGTGTFTLTGANTYSGGTVVNAGTLEGNTTSIQGDALVNAAGTLLFTQPTDGTYAGELTGAGAVTKAGAGVLTLTGDNTGHSGTTNINGGTVAIASETNIGTGTLAFDAGVLQTTGATTLANAVTLGTGGGTVQTDAETELSGVISGAGALTKTGAANLTLSGVNTYSGGTTVSAGTLTGTAVSLQGDIVNNAALVFDDAVGGAYAGDLSGTGTVTKTGTGIVTFSGTNSYTGATAINEGTLIAGGTGIGDTSAVTVGDDGTLLLGADETIGSLAGTGAVDAAAFTLTAGGNGGSTEFSGTLDGAGFAKAGTGALTLSGTGTLGDLAVDGGSLLVSGDFTAPAAVASGATLDVLTGGALTGDVTGAAGSFTKVNGTVTGAVANAGTLSGAGTIVGDVTNSGTVAPGNSPGILTVNGNYTQTSTGSLAAEITPVTTAGTGYDQLSVTGTAALDGTLAVAPASGLYVADSTYDVVRSDTGITGDFATITGNVISPFLTLTDTGIVTTTGTEQVYRLTVTRTSYATGLGALANPNRTATANGFQQLVAGATGGAATLVIGVDNMTADQAALFFDQASPESYGAYATAIQDQGELFTRQVALRLHGSDVAATGTGIWGRAYGQWGNGDNRSFRYGSDQDITGGALGVDFGNNGLIFGAAVGWSKAKVDYDLGNADGHNKGWQAGAYAGYTAGNISADLQLAYIDGNFKATRGIAAGTIATVASADFGGHLWKVVGTVGYNAELSNISVRPFVGIDYSNGKVKSFTETGADAANLTVGSIDADDTDLLVGIDLGAKPGKLAPYGRLTYRYALDNNNRDITAAFNGNAASAFTVSGVEPGKSEIDVDAGLSFALSPTSSIFAGYQGAFRKDLTRHGVSGGVRFGF